jgi:hypothetical protein
VVVSAVEMRDYTAMAVKQDRNRSRVYQSGRAVRGVVARAT